MYLRQMASYRAVLRRRLSRTALVRCALVWTRAARVAMLPDALLMIAHCSDRTSVASRC